jgi:protein tyrosine/serine phosphatase
MLVFFLCTTPAVAGAGRAPAIAEQLRRFTGRTASDEAVTAFLGVEAAYLEAALAEIEARHGSVEAYLEQAVGVDPALRDGIVERLSA